MPRPMGQQLLASQPFEVISIDFIKMPLARDGEHKYILLVVDQLTLVVLCVATKDCRAAKAARVLVDR